MSTQVIQTEPEALRMEFTPPEDLRFFRNPQGFLALELKTTPASGHPSQEGNCETYPRVQLRRALPFTLPGQYVCVTDMEDNELAVIEDIESLSDDNRELALAELGLRYYYPVVTDIKNIKEKLGTYYFDIVIGDHEKNAAVKDISKNLRQLGGGKIVLTDVDGNRFFIPDVYAIKKKILRALEPYLY